VADVNRDGSLDLVTANSTSQGLSVLLGRGDGTFLATNEEYLGFSSPQWVVAGDFDGDRFPDLAVVDFNSGLRVLMNESGVGCGVTATLVQRFAAGRVGGAVRVTWEVAEGATASAIWVERAEGPSGQAWTQPVMERSIEGRAVVEMDRSALPDRAYRYRLVARDGGILTVLDPGVLVEAQARLAFGLAGVGPSPGSGPLRIAFTLAHNAPIQIDVFDLLGRRVVTLARGPWSAGTQAVGWDGLTRGGMQAPAGIYVVRYAYPGGQERQRIMRLR
ncbi:MAG: hypothetical protein E6K72_08215, partial [Candidatus Eisenbacteria bacterium]